jgi:hypothetical protein
MNEVKHYTVIHDKTSQKVAIKQTKKNKTGSDNFVINPPLGIL